MCLRAVRNGRRYEVTLSIDNAEGLSTVTANGTKECSLCCDTPGFAVEYSSNAAGVHWQPLGTVPDKHGTPLVFNAANSTVTLTMVVEPPFKPAAVRHAWQDAPQCMLFGQPGGICSLSTFEDRHAARFSSENVGSLANSYFTKASSKPMAVVGAQPYPV